MLPTLHKAKKFAEVADNITDVTSTKSWRPDKILETQKRLECKTEKLTVRMNKIVTTTYSRDQYSCRLMDNT